MSRVYAESTTVPVSQSQSEIQKMLKQLGADRIAVVDSSSEKIILFEIKHTMYRICTTGQNIGGNRSADQKERTAWRALVLLVKAKKVAIEQGITTVEKEFMADTVMPDGSTLIDHRQAIIDYNYREGGQPKLLGFAART